MKTKLMSYLREDDLPADLKDIASECGLEVVIKLMQTFPSTTLYIPNIKNLAETARRFIRENMSKLTTRQLALETQLSQSHVRKLIRELKDEKMNDIINQ